MTEFQIQIRSYLFRVGVLLAFAILAAQLYNLQIVQGEAYTELADANRFRLSQIPASRGIIYDKNGDLLVRNRASYSVLIIPSYLPDDATAEAKIFARLSELLNLPVTTKLEPSAGYNNGHFHAITHHQYNRQLNQQIINPRSRRYINAPQGLRDEVDENRVYAPFRPITVAEDVDPITISKLEEERLDLPGVIIEIEPIREYIYGDLLGPILGYTGPIPEEQFDQYEANGYELVDTIGLSGLEFQYEESLRGRKGLENIEIDATGQKIRTISQLEEAIPGHNLRMSLDIELQRVATEALQEIMDQEEVNQGAAIAMNPNNGEILALVSLPSYDNNIFSRGITPRELSLLSDDPWTPLINHATAGFYPPGSTFKIVPATGALQERTVYSDTFFFDEGTLYLPNQFAPENRNLDQPFFCWLREGHGEVNVTLALSYSCNVYFYQIGGGYYPEEYEGLGRDRLAQWAELFGYGEVSGIDLPGEGAGLVPDARWKRLNHAEQWLTGDTYNMSVGQGFILSTPLQVVNSFAVIANGGTLYRPYLVKEILDDQGNVVGTHQPEVIRQLNIDPKFLGLIQQGLRGVIEDPAGTAYDEFDVPGIIASGKTGTAEFCDEYPECIDRNGRVQTKHAWFASYAPSYAPEIATVVFVYGGGEGSVVAVPVTNKILRHYFGIDQEPVIADDEEDDEPTETEVVTSTYTARLMASDTWVTEGSGVSGFIVDEHGQGVSEIIIEISAAGDVVAEIVSNETGQFDYLEMNDEQARFWQLRLPDYPTSAPLQLEITNGLRYWVEFEEQPPQTAGSSQTNQ
ncbi:penicillin-binding protein 2 [Anaerolineales bacterium HSG6]|nr:penicillin-binding protein 2 [Anaerolineales bacterium HSG6]